IEDTALQTNLEAADEIARQLRLRDLAGLIVIDFIDMEEKRNNRAVEKRIKEALKNDRARIQVGRISHFGLLEMSRQRIRASVMESTMDVCPHCEGAGYIRSSSSIALHVYRSIEDHLTRHSRHDVVVRCPMLISVNILNTKRTELVELEQRFGVRISIEANEHLPGQSFTIERGERSTRPKPKSLPAQMDALSDPEIMPQADGSTAEESGEEGTGRKRRRRRRSRRDDEGPNGAEPVTTDADENEASLEADGGNTSDVDGEDTKPRKRRRRGKRGGRRNRADADNENISDSDAAQSDVELASEDSGAEISANQEKPADSESNVSSTETANGAPIVESADSEAAVEPSESNGRSRNTRRPRKKADNETEQTEPVSAAVAESETKPVEENETDKPKRKKSGWWSRGGGFFN
ncbi:MAG: ribonuclease E/G, partial [Rhizobiaceae bacterium]